jgi:hypothetical protein
LTPKAKLQIRSSTRLKKISGKEQNKIQTSEPKTGAATSALAREQLIKIEHPRATRTCEQEQSQKLTLKISGFEEA